METLGTKTERNEKGQITDHDPIIIIDDETEVVVSRHYLAWLESQVDTSKYEAV